MTYSATAEPFQTETESNEQGIKINKSNFATFELGASLLWNNS